MATAVEPEVTTTDEPQETAPAADAPASPESTDEPKKTLTAPEDTKADDPPKEPGPVEYNLKLPADAVLAESDLEELAAKARSQGLTEGQAQAQVELVNETVAKQIAALQESFKPQGAAWRQVVDGFESQAKADPELHPSPEGFAQNIEKAKQVLNQFGGTIAENKPLYDALEETGYGSHPAFLKFLLNVAKATSEGTALPQGNAPVKRPKSDAEKMYDHPDNYKHLQESET